MGREKDTIKKGKKRVLQEKERYEIEILCKAGQSAKKIAELLGRHRRTIERELRRGTVEQMDSEWRMRRVYYADAGQRVAHVRQSQKGRPLKIGKDHELAKRLEELIGKKRYSPEAALATVRKEGTSTSLCVKTLYNYIDRGVFLHISNQDLPVKRDRKKRSYRPLRSVAWNNTKGRSIRERPAEVDTRESYGHWEMDCVVGKGKACLLVLTERASRQEIIYKLREKTQAQVIRCIDHLERKYKDCFSQRFASITMDNGSEFLDMASLERSCLRKGVRRTICYYAHPYCAWERGSNEVNNRLIRRFIPKGSDIGKLTSKDIKYIESWMNHYPRRQFQFLSAMDIVSSLAPSPPAAT